MINVWPCMWQYWQLPTTIQNVFPVWEKPILSDCIVIDSNGYRVNIFFTIASIDDLTEEKLWRTNSQM